MRGAFHTELAHLTFHHTGVQGAARERSRRPLCAARGRSRARSYRSQNEHFAVLANRAGKAHSVGVEATVTGDLVHEGPDRVVSAHLRSPAQGSLRQPDLVMAVKRTNASPRQSGRHALFQTHDRKGQQGLRSLTKKPPIAGQPRTPARSSYGGSAYGETDIASRGRGGCPRRYRKLARPARARRSPPWTTSPDLM